MGWKIGGVLTLVLAGVAALVSATTPAEYKTGIEWGIAAIFLVLAVLCFWRGSKASARKKAEQEDRNETYMSDQDLQQIQAGELPVLSSGPCDPGRRRTGSLLRAGAALYHEEEGRRPDR